MSWPTQIQTFFSPMSIPRTQIDISLYPPYPEFHQFVRICSSQKKTLLTLHCFLLDVISHSPKEKLLYFSYLVLVSRISLPFDSKNPFMDNILCFSKVTCQSFILDCLTQVVATIPHISSNPQGPYLSQAALCYYVSAKEGPKPSSIYCPQQECSPEHSSWVQGLLTS